MNASADSPRSEGVATVIVSLSVKPGREQEYRAWQARMTREAERWPGCAGTELIPPRAGVQEEWVVVYRFDAPERLREWLDSDVRRRILEDAGDIFAREPRQTMMTGGRSVDEGVTLVIPHVVRPGHEHGFLDVEHEIMAEESKAEGFRGVELLKPVPGVHDEWTALVRFDSLQHANMWIESRQRAGLTARLEPHVVEYEVRKVGSSFGSWFSFNMTAGKASPNWKQAMTVLLMLYPIVMIETLFLSPALPTPLYLTIFIGNALSVAALTWVLMPLATRVLNFWLVPWAHRHTTAWGSLLVLLLYALSLLAFWLTK